MAQTVTDAFRRMAQSASTWAGSPWAFCLACGSVLLGASRGWPDTGLTVVTYLMVFLIQASQNRDAKAMHLKLDELIRAVRDARTPELVDLEHAGDDELDRLDREFRAMRQRGADTDTGSEWSEP